MHLLERNHLTESQEVSCLHSGWYNLDWSGHHLAGLRTRLGEGDASSIELDVATISVLIVLNSNRCMSVYRVRRLRGAQLSCNNTNGPGNPPGMDHGIVFGVGLDSVLAVSPRVY